MRPWVIRAGTDTAAAKPQPPSTLESDKDPRLERGFAPREAHKQRKRETERAKSRLPQPKN
jgi:hypothetical protein